MYIEKSVQKITDLMKSELVLNTHLQIAQETINSLTTQVNQLTEEVARLQAAVTKKAEKVK
jgi:predicted  nucleic acid-binding Zn-ribbon protein